MKTILREAKQLIDTTSWIKGDYYNANKTGFCLVGAMAEVLGGIGNAESWSNPGRSFLEDVIEEQFPERVMAHGVVDIPTFNDHEDTTRADIDLVLEKAIAKADEIVT
jgi:hypothetical protein